MPGHARSQPETSVEQLIEATSDEDLREVVLWAAQWHEDVERRLRLIAARSTGDLGALRTEVDRALRTRRHLGYRESVEWAHAARPVISELAAIVDATPSRELVELLQRGISHVVKVMQTLADDSSGLVGDLAGDLLGLHARACDAGVADPIRLANWMIRFRTTEQDIFEPDPVRYRAALGEHGLAEFRRQLAAQPDQKDLGVQYARERLAVLDGDIDAIVTLFGEDLSTPYQFVRVAEAMAELGRDQETLEWALRGIEETRGWQTDKLYDLACDVRAGREEHAESLALRRAQYAQTPTSSTYHQLHTAAEVIDAWPLERDAARQVLHQRNPPALIDVLLSDGDADLAWETAQRLPDAHLGDETWLRLAQARQATHPADALPVYWRVIDSVLETADRRAYAAAIRLLKRARDAATDSGQTSEFLVRLARLREQHRRRPSLISMLDSAELDAPR